MANVDFSLLKKHLRADDYDGDDDYIRYLSEVAEEHICRATQRTAEDLIDLGGGEWPKPLQHAAMLLVGHWHNQREAVAGTQMTSVPHGYLSLIKPYIKLVR